MARRRASLASLAVLRSSASTGRLVAGAADSSALQAGHRLAKPGLSGFSSNSSEQTAQTRRGNAIPTIFYKERVEECGAFECCTGTRTLTGGCSGRPGSWRKVTHGDIVSELCDSTV